MGRRRQIVRARKEVQLALKGPNGNLLPFNFPSSTPIYGYVREPYAGAWQEGASINPIGALTSFSAVFACITRIASDIAKLAIKLKVIDNNGILVDAPSNSPFWGVIRKPNQVQNRIQFVIMWVVSKLLFGNTYVFKIRDDRSVVRKLYVLDSRRVTPHITELADVYYNVGGDPLNPELRGIFVPSSEIIHDRGITIWHPLVGVSPITACAVSATQGMNIQNNSSVFFSNMSRPSGALTSPGKISDETAERLKREWEKNYGQGNLGRTAVLGDGLKYEPMAVTPEDAELMKQLDWTVADVSRAFGVPLYKIGAGPLPTGSNIEAQEIQYYTGCLQILIESLELCLKEGLELPPEYHVEFDLDGLMRMDSVSQTEVLTKQVQGAILAPDEARRKLNLPPVPGGKYPLAQQQNYSLEALAKRDALPNPFAPNQPVASQDDTEDDTSDETDTEDEDTSDEAEEASFVQEVVKELASRLISSELQLI